MAMFSGQQLARVIKGFALAVFGLLAALVLLVAGLWWWAGTDGSLATAVRLADDYLPHLTKNIRAQNPSGSLRAGGRIDRITWQDGGLLVDARDVTLSWQAWALASGTLKLDSLVATSVLVEDKRPQTTAAKPPDSLRIPVRVELDAFDIAQLNVTGLNTGLTAFSASGMAGSYSFNEQQHALELTRATVASGNYSGRASIAADKPFNLNAALAGTVSAVVPESKTPLPLSFSATAIGPLADLHEWCQH
jgi:translocation and assembly module TamB